MPATQPTQNNTGLIVIVVGIFMVIVAFLAVTYLNSDKIRQTQEKNTQQGQINTSDIDKLACALWRSVGDPKKVNPSTVQRLQTICKGSS